MDFDIINYINLSSGEEMYTKAIQSAIDACAAAGGGRVIIKNGVYRIGIIILKSNVNLHQHKMFAMIENVVLNGRSFTSI